MSFSLSPQSKQASLALLQKCNELSERYGLALTEGQMLALQSARREALESAGRLEFGEGVMGKLVYAFCDSPYITRQNYFETLLALQDDFYAFKSELDEQLSDDELIEGMLRVFHGKAQGSLEFLEGVSLGALYRAALGRDEIEE